ncbi:MAG: methyltransferase domain-containing protein [Anaerolineae bacterium]|nr:methyltransferase domain-containing protein [Anaerolineae bacterium]
MLQRLYFELRYLFQDTPWDSGETPPEVHEYLEEHPPGHAIDLGCGPGTNVITLAQGGWEAVGIDISRTAIAIAHRRARRAQVDARFVRGDAARVLEYEAIQGPFDLALDIGCLHALSESARPQYAGQISGLLKPEGTYLLYSFLNVSAPNTGRWPRETEIKGLFAGEFDLQGLDHGHFRERPSAWFTFRRAA